jgi:alcohol dehydrogenase class IV
MRPFSTGSFPNVIFGLGASSRAGELLADRGVKKVMAVYDEGVFKAGLVTPILERISAAGIEVVSFDKVNPDPQDVVVEECAGLANQENVDGFIGIGGGSSMDTAKIAAVYRHCVPPIHQYFDGEAKGHPSNKARRDAALLLVPTTAGTGAEMTGGGVITDTRTGSKRSFPAMKAQADLAILDPLLTVGLPKHITAITGMDALSQLIESMTSSRRSARTDMIGGYAVRCIWRSLPVAYENGTDLEARSEMLFAANLSLSCDGQTNLGHAIATAMGSKLHLAHGHACALALPEQVRYVSGTCDRELRVIAESMGLDSTSSTIAEDIASAIRTMNQQLGMKTAREMNLTLDDFLGLTDEVFGANGFNLSRLDQSPGPDQLAQILANIYRG